MDNITSQLVVTANGEIEYARFGNGLPVLISHGTLGGFDQGVAVARLFDRTAFCFLTPSRAGYLRSSAQTGRNPDEQAHSYVELLDREGIGSAVIMGLSGGAPSALRFAQNYPNRCQALVLISSIVATPPALPPFFRMAIRGQDIMMRFDHLWALVHRYGLKMLVRSNGVSPDQAARIFEDPHLLSIVRGIFQPILTSSARQAGMRLDDIQIQSLPDEHSYKIRTPTFICHAANDPLASPASAYRLAANIPGAEYHEYPNGGHLFFVVHSSQVVPAIEQFLLANVPD